MPGPRKCCACAYTEWLRYQEAEPSTIIKYEGYLRPGKVSAGAGAVLRCTVTGCEPHSARPTRRLPAGMLAAAVHTP